MVYLERALNSADLYLLYGIAPNKIIFTAVGTDGTQYDYENFAEEERLMQSLNKLYGIYHNPKHGQAAIDHLNGILNYAQNATTGVMPCGDGSGYQPIAGLSGTKSTFTDNEIPIKPLWDLIHNDPRLMKLLDVYYDYFGRSDGRVCGVVQVTTGSCLGGHNTSIINPAVASILVEATALTGDPKYLIRAEAIWNRYMTIRDNSSGEGVTGMFYGHSEADGSKWFVMNYDWAFARSLATCLKYSAGSTVILEAARRHADALIQYSFNLDGRHHWAHPINADTGAMGSLSTDGGGYSMPTFAEMYMDSLFLELYRLTGDGRYLDAVQRNVPLDVADFQFPTHNITSIIDRNLDLYMIAADPGRLDAAKTIGDKLVTWINAQNGWIWGGLEGSSSDRVQVDNFWHAVLSLINLGIAAGEAPPLNWKLDLNCNIEAPLYLDGTYYGKIPASLTVPAGVHTLKLDEEVVI